MAAIEFMCQRHVEPNRKRAGLSVVGGRWGYCAGDAHNDHDWLPIQPTDVSSIELARAAREIEDRG